MVELLGVLQSGPSQASKYTTTDDGIHRRCRTTESGADFEQEDTKYIEPFSVELAIYLAPIRSTHQWELGATGDLLTYHIKLVETEATKKAMGSHDSF